MPGNQYLLQKLLGYFFSGGEGQSFLFYEKKRIKPLYIFISEDKGVWCEYACYKITPNTYKNISNIGTKLLFPFLSRQCFNMNISISPLSNCIKNKD